jgi:hypothetical protein
LRKRAAKGKDRYFRGDENGGKPDAATAIPVASVAAPSKM